MQLCVCAESAISGLGALPPTEAIYLLTNQDSLNRTLDASNGNNYTISFTVPLPAQAFWSLTLYNSSNFLLIQNPIDRYNIGDRVSAQTSTLAFHWSLCMQRVLEVNVTAGSLACSG